MLIPLQIVGLVMNSVIAVLLGMYAVKKGAGAGKGVEVETNEKEKAGTEALKKSRGYLIFNFLLTCFCRDRSIINWCRKILCDLYVRNFAFYWQ